jgi:hypothetical protein
MLSSAQEKKAIEPPVQIGLSFSTLGGPGIYYMHPVSEAGNIKFTGIIIYSNDSDYKESFFSLGVEYQRDLVEDTNKRGYFTAGAHVDNQVSNDLYFSGNYNTTRSSYFSTGLGLGFDYGNTKKGIVLNAHISYQITNGLGNTDDFRVGLGGGVGIGFNF